LSTTHEPFAPVPASDDPSRGQEVWAPTGGAFEAPAKVIEDGPLYTSVEERMPELTQRSDSDEKKNKAGFTVDRRDFMKLFSAASMAATAAYIERPLEKAIPYVNQPTDQWPGEPVYYASTCAACTAGCGIMVKTREGRPTKVEGLPEHPISKGKLCATGQGAIQGLFHPERPRGPRIRFGQGPDTVSWTDAYEHLGAKLAKTTRIGILTNGSTGNRHAFFKEFLERMGAPATNLWTFESNTLMEAITAAHKQAFGVNAMPRADLDQARVIVGIGSDFLDVGVSPVYHSQTYTQSHAFKSGIRGKHYQLESGFTLTGAKADERFPIAPGSETLATLLLARSLLENKTSKGSSAARGQIQQVLEQKNDLVSGGYDRVGVKREEFDRIAAELLSEPSVVLCGSSYAFDENATNLQLAAIMVNELIGAYDSTLQLAKGWMTPPVNVGDLTRFLADVGNVDVLFVVDTNPIHNLPPSFGVRELLAKVPTIVSIQDFPNEVDQIAHYSLNGHHYLESWGDEQPVAGFWSMRQPTVRPTYDSRQAEDICLWLAATVKKPMGYESYRDFLKK
jgi:molybdopterin-containing oxidoreductase family iron-sulfur binding subunit